MKKTYTLKQARKILGLKKPSREVEAAIDEKIKNGDIRIFRHRFENGQVLSTDVTEDIFSETDPQELDNVGT